ncbi:hypothetical protein JTB14_038428 [Gonioctena quinquepunctata]|nr:hypothetical protein JTB14_038428 [Gonioctena quinquepunctata]
MKSIEELDNNSVLVSDLTEEEKQRVTQYVRFVIRGKLARGVPVLLHKSMHQCITVILNYRVEQPIHFGIPQSEKSNVFHHVLATDLTREFLVACGAKNPKSLRVTNLRKHVATHSMTLNLQNEDIENLQSYMGHADKIHKEYYRQPLVHKDIVNMSKVLLSAQGKYSTFGSVSRTQVAYPHAMGDLPTFGITVPSTSGGNVPSTSGVNIPHSSSCDNPPSSRRNSA